VRRSFRLLKSNCDLSWRHQASESDLSDVSDLSSVSTSLTSVSGKDRHINLQNPLRQRQQPRGRSMPRASHEISRTIQELSLLYKTRDGHEDEQTMTSLSTLNTVDFINMASRPPQHQRARPSTSPLETDESDSGTLHFASSVLSSNLIEGSPVSSSTHKRKQSSGVGALLVQHGNILPTQSSPMRSLDTSAINPFSPSKSPLLSQGRRLSRSHGGSPIGHRSPTPHTHSCWSEHPSPAPASPSALIQSEELRISSL
jgi:hypothetical protein